MLNTHTWYRHHLTYERHPLEYRLFMEISVLRANLCNSTTTGRVCCLFLSCVGIIVSFVLVSFTFNTILLATSLLCQDEYFLNLYNCSIVEHLGCIECFCTHHHHNHNNNQWIWIFIIVTVLMMYAFFV